MVKLNRRMMLWGLAACTLSTPVWGAGELGRSDANPAMVARRCVHRIREVAGFSMRRMHAHTNRCVSIIGRLLEAGHEEEASAAAARCKEALGAMAEHASRAVSSIAERCVAVLTRMEAPEELIIHVKSAAEEAMNAIRERMAAEMQRIEDALGGGDDGDTGDEA